MILDILETVKSAFDRINSKASLGVAGLAIGLITVLFGGLALAGAATLVNPILAGVIGLVIALVYIAGLASMTVGSLRAFDQKTVNKEMFTENILWPFLRMTGSNIVLQAFIFGAAYLVFYPAAILTLGASGMLQAGAETMPELGTAAMTGLGIAGAITVAAALYVFAALSLSLPRISISDKRLFQSLDESVQATKGKRLKVMVTMAPFVLLLIAALAALLYLGEILGLLVYIALAIIAGLYWLALLAELNDRL